VKLRPRLLPGLAILLAACATGSPSPPATRPAAAIQEEAEAQARAADLAFSASAVGHDASAFAAFLEADAIFVSPGSVDVGARSVCAGWAPLLAPGGPTLEWTPDVGLATGSGDLVLTRGAYTFTPADRGPPRTGRYLTVWRRRPDGRLAVALDASDTPLPAESARAARRSLRRLLSADGGLGATAGLLLDGEREVGGYVLVEVREGDGWRVLAEVGDWRPG
jgi:ketosteroid isomerase-like protein